jgi:glutathione peroxidase
MKFGALALIAGILMAGNVFAEDKEAPESALDFKMKTLAGKEVDLTDYKGKVVVMVNVASRCGRTPQYEPLQALYEKHKDDGLVVLAFPCNQFGKQEPGTAEEIQEFCTTNYGVTFPIFSKIEVNGDDAAPLYQYLTSLEPETVGTKSPGKIGWNFEKFLVGRDGKVVKRFGSKVDPAGEEMTTAISAELKKE